MEIAKQAERKDMIICNFVVLSFWDSRYAANAIKPTAIKKMILNGIFRITRRSQSILKHIQPRRDFRWKRINCYSHAGH